MKLLLGQTALVTGAVRGIGRAIAAALAREGRKWMLRVERLFDAGKDVPPTRGADTVVALASGRVTMHWQAAPSASTTILDDLLERKDEILKKDLKTLRFR